jgi:hypothetical protein
MRTGIVLRILPPIAAYAATIRAGNDRIMSGCGDLA